ALKVINIPNSVTRIGAEAFEGCTSLITVDIPDSVVTIGYDAFHGCSRLSSVIIRGNVLTVDFAAFANCINLSNVWFSGTETDRNGISFNGDNEIIENAVWHYNTCNEHSYSKICDTTCDECEWIRPNPVPHTYNNSCDTSCNICKATRTITHTYSNNCDKSCNVCGKTRTVGAHKYSNNCDTTCNYCSAKRTIKHTYSNNCDTKCNVCSATRTITHTYKTTTTKATLSKNGSIVKKCTVCGKVASNTAIKYAKTFKLSTTTYTYNGKVKTPSVTVKDSAGKTLKKNTDYTVSYASGRKNVGTYKVTIKMIGKYSGTKTLTFKINPAKTTVSKLTAGKKSITVAITKKSTQVTGYQIQYSTSKKFTNAKTKTISSYKTTKYTLKSLSAKKTYYVRVRTYKTVGKTKYYSGWSTYKYVKAK
ncbi:MAG: leucine-rich repeat protein, partial [Clostridia bacterium]|nr:leucine-rich repeat protein [Clostridia bacterium]